MKQAFQLVSRFVLLSIFFILVLGSLVVLTRYVSGYDPQRASAADIVVQMPSAARGVFAVSLMISALVAIFATIRKTDRPLVPLGLLAAVWTALLVVGSLLWSVPPLNQAEGVAGVPADRIIRVANLRIFSPTIEGDVASPLLVQRLDGVLGMEIFAQANLNPESRSLTIPDRPDIILDLAEIEGSYPGMVRTPDRLNPLLRDIAGLNRLILEAPTRLPAVVLGMFLLSCWTPARLTRWPLFNAVLVFLCVRGALWLVNWIHFGDPRSLVSTVASPDQLGLISAGALAFLALVSLVTLFLLPPLASWKREVGDD